jgi:hypothetical protein
MKVVMSDGELAVTEVDGKVDEGAFAGFTLRELAYLDIEVGGVGTGLGSVAQNWGAQYARRRTRPHRMQVSLRSQPRLAGVTMPRRVRYSQKVEPVKDVKF